MNCHNPQDYDTTQDRMDEATAADIRAKLGSKECICESRSNPHWNSGDCPVHYPVQEALSNASVGGRRVTRYRRG